MSHFHVTFHFHKFYAQCHTLRSHFTTTNSVLNVIFSCHISLPQILCSMSHLKVTFHFHKFCAHLQQAPEPSQPPSDQMLQILQLTTHAWRQGGLLRHSGSRDSLLVRVPYSWLNNCEFKSRQEWRENFLLLSQLCVLTLIRCPFHPCVTAVARKRPQSFCQKCRWQVTPKQVYTFDPMKSGWADYATVQA